MRSGDAFVHGVASGDPLADAVVIWTRVTAPSHDGAEVSWAVAHDPELRDVVASGDAYADPDTDHTVKVDVGGLDPGSIYYYGFEGLGQRSPVARAKTLPGPGCRHLRIASVSCAKYNAGFFNIYMLSEIRPERIIGKWWFVDTVLRRTDVEVRGAAWRVDRGTAGTRPAGVRGGREERPPHGATI